MVEICEFGTRGKQRLPAGVDLRWFPAKVMAPSATSDISVPLLIRYAGTSSSAVAGGGRSIITDVARTLLRLSVGKRSRGVELVTIRESSTQSTILRVSMGANANASPGWNKARYNSIRQCSRSILRSP